ncbi:calumenin-like isoform X1 [Pecten maximus]|uniref:calumenin-like isoform X1 n=1 Tax=Pecten maximus TaxID=6579 RepID=UPI0014583EE6|nr:calumenin-like isoform X1 [Pecten maximus]XP_033751879.1 calumenin-like isoform X1 [Pecten maximus]
MSSSPLTMKLLSVCLILVLMVVVYCSAIPKPGDKRVHETKLSDLPHDDDNEHNEDYDHEAFLGKDDAQDFDDLSPEESKERLAIIVDKIDVNKDGKVTETELKEWIQFIQRRYIVTDTERMWKEHDLEEDKLHWKSYMKRTYGYEDSPDSVDSPTFSYKDTIDRDHRRWEAADTDKDMKLSKDEFVHFLHPEDSDHMRDVVVQETIEDIDKDKDGYISLDEYISDVYDEDDEDDEHDEAPHEGEPDWVVSERQQFESHRDHNKDGKLDKDEVREWIMPEDFDHSGAEATHLMNSADENRDGDLSKDEILEHYDLFVGSQATDFGEALTRHDEF